MSIEPSNIDFAELAKQIISENNVPAKRNNKASRVAAWKGSVETLPPEKAVELVKIFDEFPVQHFGSVLEGTEARVLEEEELVALAAEKERSDKLKEIAGSVDERAKKLVFDHMNLTEGTGDVNVDIPGTNMRFRRSSTGSTDPVADWNRLNEVVDTDEDLDRLAPKEYTLTLTESEYEYLMGRANKDFRDNALASVRRNIDVDAAMRYVMESRERQRRFAKILTPGTSREGSFYFEKTAKGE